MRQGIYKEPDWQYLGALLAQQDDNEQVAFFQGFAAECRSWGTHLQIEQQLAYVNNGLSKEDRELLSMITYKEGGRA